MRNPAPPLPAETFSERFSDRDPALTPQAAVVEANRCLNCYGAPCMSACPTHIDVPKFIKKIASGNLRGSAATILDANVLGLSCSRVCPVEVLCEGACVMHRYNKQPIEIGRLQRHAMDWFYAHNPALPIAAAETGKSVACIGSGPASLACAAELRRHGVAVTIFDRKPLAGGLNTYGIAQYKLRPVDSQKEVELVRAAGVTFRLGEAVDGDIEALEQEFDAIFLGVGLGPTRPLNIPGDRLRGVMDALEFIARYKTREGVVGERVVVIGAGNTAIDAASAAVRLGAKEVHILYRRGESEMSAFRSEYESARQDGIRFHWWAKPVRILGETSVEGLDAETSDAVTLHLDCDMVIPAIGQVRLVDFLAQCRGVETEDGRVRIDPATGQTSNAKYFAGGDCVNGGREVVDAVADGKRAALGIVHHLGLEHMGTQHG